MLQGLKMKKLVWLLRFRVRLLNKLESLRAPTCVINDQRRVVAKTRREVERRGYDVEPLLA